MLARHVYVSACHGHRAPAHVGNAHFLCTLFWKIPLTPLTLSLYNLQSPSTADIKIDIETVEKLIGEIIAQPLR